MTDKMRTIITVRTGEPGIIFVNWSDGISAALDARRILGKNLPVEKNFARVQVLKWGHGISWDDGTEIGADRLWLETLSATGHDDAREFLDWRLRHDLSLTDAATALGISRRMVAYYSNGEKPVPRAISLACKGWKLEAA
jgi:hypothetical protein